MPPSFTSILSVVSALSVTSVALYSFTLLLYLWFFLLPVPRVKGDPVAVFFIQCFSPDAIHRHKNIL